MKNLIKGAAFQAITCNSYEHDVNILFDKINGKKIRHGIFFSNYLIPSTYPMKYFLLLRNNKQSGPYSINEITALNLLSTDLIWIEGISSCWKYPQELTEFSNLTIIDKKTTPAYRTTTTSTEDVSHSRVFVSLPQSTTKVHSEVKSTSRKTENEYVEFEVKYVKPLDEIKEMYVENLQKRNTWQNSSFNFSTFAVPVGMFAVLIFSAFVIKEIIENFDDDYVNTTETTSIAIPYDQQNKEEPGADFQNALSIEIEMLNIDTVQTVPIPKKKKVEKVEKVENLYNLVNVKSDDYKKRILGGIEGFELTVTNKSSHVLDEVLVEVSYLKPNGDVVKTDTYEVNSVPAKGSKAFSVPPSNRGVKIKYKITNIISRQHKATLVQA